MAHPRRSLGRRPAVAALAVVCAAALATPALAQRHERPPGTAGLAWSGCPQISGFDCATARVPLNYRNPAGRMIDLAVIARRATDPAHRIGTLFFNPGGPGVSGTTALPLMYAYFPAELRERFDVVSWDPRGVGNSTAVRCFATAAEAETWAAGLPQGFPTGARERARWIASQAELGRRCEQRDPALLRHISTTDTARDLDLLRAAMGEPKLNYLGISYGTYLGATYANLYPNRVKAMALDGNVDPHAWVEHHSPLSTFLRLGSDLGSSQTLTGFLDLCGRSTPQRCAFSAGSAAATRVKFVRLLQRLRRHPQGPFTYGATVGAVAQSLYTVHPAWTTLANALQDLWLGRTPSAAAASAGRAPFGPAPYPGFEQLPAVLCSESPDPRDPRHYFSLEEFSYDRAGDVGRDWAWTNEVCATWPARAAHRYVGPWDRSIVPVLTIGVTSDPATAYQSTLAMTRQLANARLVTVAGYGHSALLNPSSCANRYESRYFIDGALPPRGTICRQDTPPFSAPTGTRRELVLTGGIRPGGLPGHDRHGGLLSRHPLRLAR